MIWQIFISLNCISYEFFDSTYLKYSNSFAANRNKTWMDPLFDFVNTSECSVLFCFSFYKIALMDEATSEQ